MDVAVQPVSLLVVIVLFVVTLVRLVQVVQLELSEVAALLIKMQLLVVKPILNCIEAQPKYACSEQFTFDLEFT